MIRVGKCDACGKKVKIMQYALFDREEPIHWGDKILEGCEHYRRGKEISPLNETQLNLRDAPNETDGGPRTPTYISSSEMFSC